MFSLISFRATDLSQLVSTKSSIWQRGLLCLKLVVNNVKRSFGIWDTLTQRKFPYLQLLKIAPVHSTWRVSVSLSEARGPDFFPHMDETDVMVCSEKLKSACMHGCWAWVEEQKVTRNYKTKGSFPFIILPVCWGNHYVMLKNLWPAINTFHLSAISSLQFCWGKLCCCFSVGGLTFIPVDVVSLWYSFF